MMIEIMMMIAIVGMVSFPWEEGPEWYAYAFGIGYYVRHVEFGSDGDVFHIFSKADNQFLREIRITEEHQCQNQMQKVMKAWKLFRDDGGLIRDSWWE